MLICVDGRLAQLEEAKDLKSLSSGFESPDGHHTNSRHRNMTHISTSRREWLLDKQHILNKLYNGVERVYGPYLSKDQRYRVVLHSRKGKTTKQFSKIKMEVILGRRLGPDETVDHKDNNTKNDRRKNLRVLDRSEHIKQDALRRRLIKLPCVFCGTVFTLTRDQIPKREGKAGPFCSRTCSGKYGASVQNGAQRLGRDVPKPTYHRIKH